MRQRRWLTGAVLAAAIAVFAVVLGSGLRDANSAGTGQYALLNKPAPDLRGPTLNGGSFDLASLRGSTVVVNVWASWCEPCRQELPVIRDITKRWPGAGVKVVTIDTRDGVTTARTFLRQVHATGLLTVRDPQGRLAVAWGASGVPETYVVDPNGVVRARHLGPVSTAWLGQQLTGRPAT